MVHAKGLSDKTVEGILLNNDSEDDFYNGNINKSSGSVSQYEIVIQRWKIPPMASGNFQFSIYFTFQKIHLQGYATWIWK